MSYIGEFLQPPIVAALIGFSGVIITLLVNAKLARVADARKAAQEEERKASDLRYQQQCLRKILSSEIEHIQKWLLDVVENIKTKRKTILFSDYNRTRLFSTFSKELSLLKHDEIKAVVLAYHEYDELFAFVAQFHDGENSRRIDGRGQLWLKINEEDRKFLLEYLSEKRRIIVSADTILSKNLILGSSLKEYAEDRSD